MFPDALPFRLQASVVWTQWNPKARSEPKSQSDVFVSDQISDQCLLLTDPVSLMPDATRLMSTQYRPRITSHFLPKANQPSPTLLAPSRIAAHVVVAVADSSYFLVIIGINEQSDAFSP